MKIICFLLLIISINSCKGAPSNSPKSNNHETVIVDLKETISPLKIEAEFSHLNLKYKKTISKPLNIVLFTFNNAKITAIDLVKILRNSSNVENAQTNKNVNNRI